MQSKCLLRKGFKDYMATITAWAGKNQTLFHPSGPAEGAWRGAGSHLRGPDAGMQLLDSSQAIFGTRAWGCCRARLQSTYPEQLPRVRQGIQHTPTRPAQDAAPYNNPCITFSCMETDPSSQKVFPQGRPRSNPGSLHHLNARQRDSRNGSCWNVNFNFPSPPKQRTTAASR